MVLQDKSNRASRTLLVNFILNLKIKNICKVMKEQHYTDRVLLIDNKIYSTSILNPFSGIVKINLKASILNDYETIAVYDAPAYLPFWYNELKKYGFDFKYHVAIYFDPLDEFKSNNLLASHVGILLMSKRFMPNKVKIPHQYCMFCKDYLKDWGGKTHLMHPSGSLISDVWKDFPLNYKDIINNNCPTPVIKRLEDMFKEVSIINCKKEVIYNNRFEAQIATNNLSTTIKNVILNGDAAEVLKTIPTNTIDMIFIDPPYNLRKKYLNYEDKRKDYIEWTLTWINECFRILKPQGSLFLLNIPKWAHEILVKLLPNYYLVRWIVWDEPAEPRGKLIPAHYALLWLAKTANVKSYQLKEQQDSMNYCLRIRCIKKRRSLGIKDKVNIRDVRWDIHRIKHNNKRFRYHPAQLPEKLLSFIIELTTNEGDIVLDPMVGTGTSVAVAKKMGRAFIGIDIDPIYVEITNKRLLERWEEILILNKNLNNERSEFTKKMIQIKMSELAQDLGHLPTIDEASAYLRIEKNKLTKVFPNWNKALKLARVKLQLTMDQYTDKNSSIIRKGDKDVA